MPKSIATAACLCLLLLQCGGLHVHADEAGYFGAPATAYAHGHDPHDHHAAHDPAHDPGTHQPEHSEHGESGPNHDHGDVRDVSLIEAALGASKLPFAIIAPALSFTACARTKTLASADVDYPVLSGRHTRWRPPLRAPPQSA